MKGVHGYPGLAVSLALIASSAALAQSAAMPTIAPGALPRLGTVDERFQSYNIEMLEVTGGRFWKPYSDTSTVAPAAGSTPAGMSPDMYAYRAPKDLSSARLRALAVALGPVYVRVSGTWANSTYLPAEGETIKDPPTGFNGVLTRAQWKGVIDFAQATHAEIVTSFATSPGTRDAGGTWLPAQANRFVATTKTMGGRIAAADFMNEPTIAVMGGAPKGYDPAQYGKDFDAFHHWARSRVPEMKIAGPGSVGESVEVSASQVSLPGFLPTPQLLEAMGKDDVDVFSYHAYSGVSQRCKGLAPKQQTTADAALSEAWLARTDGILAFYKAQRDQYEPGKPMWLTETAETACGGNPWAATFLDSFRYLDQMGRLAKGGVQVVMHNTLAASDYALLDETTYEPRPNYWAALLWRRLMGATVLEAGVPLQPGLHLYAHCLRAVPGGVALLVIQNDRTEAHTLTIPLASERYTLASRQLEGRQVALNGKALALQPGDALPKLVPAASPAGATTFAPETITFLAIPKAANVACR